MVSLSYPHNRLQEVLFNRFKTIVYVHVGLISFLLGTFFFTNPVYASGVIDPTNATGYPLTPPSQAYVGSCTSSTVCPKYVWFAGDHFVGGDYTNSDWQNRTCVFVTPNPTGSNELAELGNLIGSGNGSYWARWARGPDGGSTGIACYNAGTWTNYPRSTIGVDADSITVTSNQWTAAKITQYGGLINSNSNVYACSGGTSTACDSSIVDLYDDQLIVFGGGIPSYSLLLTGGNPVIGGNLSFKSSWSNLPFPVFRISFYKDTNRAQYHDLLWNALNLTNTNNFSFNLSYSSSGTMLPDIVLGNSFCTSESGTGAFMKGTGCNYLSIPYGSLRIYSGTESANTNSGSTIVGSWIGPSDPNHYYGTGHTIFAPSANVDTATGNFLWVAGTGSNYYNQFSNCGSSSTPCPTDLIGPKGVFNSKFWNFSGFGSGDTGNPILNYGQGLVSYVLQAAVQVGAYIFGSILQVSAFYSFIYGTLHPPEASVHTLPLTLFGIHNPFFAGQTFTVHYHSNSGNAQNVTILVQIASMLGAFVFLSRRFYFSSR